MPPNYMNGFHFGYVVLYFGGKKKENYDRVCVPKTRLKVSVASVIVYHLPLCWFLADIEKVRERTNQENVDSDTIRSKSSFCIHIRCICLYIINQDDDGGGLGILRVSRWSVRISSTKLQSSSSKKSSWSWLIVAGRSLDSSICSCSRN